MRRTTALPVSSLLCAGAMLCLTIATADYDPAAAQTTATKQASPTASGQTPDSADTSKLPRFAGAREIYASAATTILVSPKSVEETSAIVLKALNEAGWQSYGRPNATNLADASMQILSLKKGPVGLSVMISLAPAQGNATAVNYVAVALKNDLPFPGDATEIGFDPDRPLLMLVTRGSVEETLKFYRSNLATSGWHLWAQRLNDVQPAGGPDGEMTRSGGYAYYAQGDKRFAVVQLERADDGRLKVKFEELPLSYLRSMKTSFFNSDNTGVPLVDLASVARLDGAVTDTSRTSADQFVYSVPMSLPNTVAATEALLASNGWKPYGEPLGQTSNMLRSFKNDRQALSVSFTMTAGQASQSSVQYSPSRLTFALAAPDDASGLIFDTHRPYLAARTAGAVDEVLAFYRKELADAGWSALSASDIAARWPDAKAEAAAVDGAREYFARGPAQGTGRPIMLTLARGNGGTDIEIKVPPFARPQALSDGSDVFGLPVPEERKSSAGRIENGRKIVTASVAAELDVVLAYYRKIFAAKGIAEQTQSAVIAPDKAALRFASSDGAVDLTLGTKYDLTTVQMIQQAPPGRPPNVADAMKDVQQMLRDAGVSVPMMQPPAAPASKEASLAASADNKMPVPMPDGAEDVDFDGSAGKLEFSQTASTKAVADFYRGAMKTAGWTSRPGVINNANMVVLSFAKAGKSVELTIMRMGPVTKVTASGAALRSASAAATVSKSSPAATAVARTPVIASEDDLVAEETSGMPVPKRRTMSQGTSTPFRKELKASVPLELVDVLGFYRRELKQRQWMEADGAKVAADNAALSYTTPDGPGVLRLSRKDDATEIALLVRNPTAATKAGVLPKSGRAKVMFGNINPAAATLTFNNKQISIAAGAGTKGPDGPSLDLPPGKYRYSIKLPGRPAQSDTVEVGADETWGLMVGPGGVLALEAY